MPINEIILEIRNSLKTTFEKIETWFDLENDLLHYKPSNGGWTIQQVLEHIALTNHFLLILIDKGAVKALINAQKNDYSVELANYQFPKAQLTEVGLHQSFTWIRPEHMEPKGEKSLLEVKDWQKK